MGSWTVSVWLRLAADYRAGEIAQAVVPITGAEGWLKYLSKHASRGWLITNARGSLRAGSPLAGCGVTGELGRLAT